MMDDLLRENTKADLRELAYNLDLSIPRGATKRDIADLVLDEMYESGRRVTSGSELDHIPRGAVVLFAGEAYWSKGPSRRQHVAELWRDDGAYVLNGALRGPFTLFRDDEDGPVAAADMAVWVEP